MPFLRSPFRPDENYAVASRLFIKALALIYFAAFVSLAPQISGLAGEEGILPFRRVLDQNLADHGLAALLRVPTLFWFDASDVVLEGAAWTGAGLALLLLFGRWERVALILLFVLYLSLYRAGQLFMNFQWDTLLLEAGLLAVFLHRSPTVLVLFLFHWLLFRLRFMSGVFKLASGDPSWAGFTALDHYFETQPLPHVGAWFAHWLPEWLHRAGVGLTFFTELLLPFFLFLPRPFRLAAVGLTLLMQVLILATSNHNFFNLLTIALCLLLLDDRVVNRLLPRRDRKAPPVDAPGAAHRVSLAVVAVLLITSSLGGFLSLLGVPVPEPVARVRQAAQAFGVGAVYHVFPTMQTERQELIIEGSDDGREWKAYTFRYKPQDPGATPRFIVPHQPRLDWLMWFVPTQHPVHLFWFGELMYSLERGSAPVLSLLADNPFPDRPPRHLRVTAWRYRFTTPEERARTGLWWRREYLGLFPMVPPRRP